MIVSAWNVADMPKMKLPPCHALFQFYVADGKLSCQLYQRSADIFLGVPFNIASYALLTHMMAQQAGLEVGDFIWTGGDCHLYATTSNRWSCNCPRAVPLPELEHQAQAGSLFDYKFEDFEIVGYESPSAHQGAGGGTYDMQLTLIVRAPPQPRHRPDNAALAPAGGPGALQAPLGRPIIMGRKTCESMRAPAAAEPAQHRDQPQCGLPGRGRHARSARLQAGAWRCAPMRRKPG